jgi:HEAT repeat protein
VLRAWQDAIRTRNANGVLNAQSLFLSREGDYRESLMTMAAEDSEPRIRAFSVAVLGRMKSPPPESFFLQRLDDASEYPRTSTLQALEKIGTAACLPKVDGLTSSDPVASVRAAAQQTAKAVRSR